MNGMGSPKHYQPLGKWFWIVVLIILIVGFALGDMMR